VPIRVKIIGFMVTCFVLPQLNDLLYPCARV